VSDEGSAGVLLLGVAALGLLLMAGVGIVGSLVVARSEAAAAADAAALAAAPVTFRPFGAAGTPAEEAARFATANRTRLIECVCPVDRSWAPRTVRVVVERTVDLGAFGSVPVRASSRAEFTPALLIGGS
jgi:secretion/DNA translocation related TadE-like protein